MYQTDLELFSLATMADKAAQVGRMPEVECRLLPDEWIGVIETHIRNGARALIAIHADTNWSYGINYLLEQLSQRTNWQVEEKNTNTYLLHTKQEVVTIHFVNRARIPD